MNQSLVAFADSQLRVCRWCAPRYSRSQAALITEYLSPNTADALPCLLLLARYCVFSCAVLLYIYDRVWPTILFLQTLSTCASDVQSNYVGCYRECTVWWESGERPWTESRAMIGQKWKGPLHLVHQIPTSQTLFFSE
ncbi:hypothetical protein BU24DRAFT_24408 [Aaosphaeria arxii CBS 175.79]|uniref:Uncharacterized protein n=1 Tax=Aaosphaeria arxii CBS 175.79 TaxID=1450172 RepID=A0A6A5Y7T1_9PLEO|nr:uncharacterized protein BU24DRAFT_24408 [Aaosphaeria arxii CBS 175.79]KAF2021635.1 hypothetical protein BU24DRAFT_24408 [Aaosphaeria arxii CBS 175.79]